MPALRAPIMRSDTPLESDVKDMIAAQLNIAQARFAAIGHDHDGSRVRSDHPPGRESAQPGPGDRAEQRTCGGCRTRPHLSPVAGPTRRDQLIGCRGQDAWKIPWIVRIVISDRVDPGHARQVDRLSMNVANGGVGEAAWSR